MVLLAGACSDDEHIATVDEIADRWPDEVEPLDRISRSLEQHYHSVLSDAFRDPDDVAQFGLKDRGESHVFDVWMAQRDAGYESSNIADMRTDLQHSLGAERCASDPYPGREEVFGCPGSFAFAVDGIAVFVALTDFTQAESDRVIDALRG